MFADVSTNPVSDGEVLTFNTGIGQWEGRPLTPYQAIVDVTTNYTLSASDHGKYIMCKQPITITLPSSGLPDGFQCVLFNDSTGTITISTAIAFKSKGNLLENLYGAAHLVYNNSTWIALGDLS